MAFSRKAHIGVDAVTRMVHTLVTTTAKSAEITKADALMHGEEKLLCADHA